MSISNQTVGVTGTYLVAAELSRRGFVALVTTRNTESVDIIASNPKVGKSASIQVKATRGIGKTKRGEVYWILSKKAERLRQPHFFYVFVTVSDLPRYYVVPSRNVADYVARIHRAWLKKRGRHGRRHKDSSMRMWLANEKYRDKWQLLGLR
jgi:hypothetical protein